MTSPPVEKVLVIACAWLWDMIPKFQGFKESAELGVKLGTLFSGKNTVFLNRREMEVNPGFKQLIPYVIFQCGEKFFAYRRVKGTGESRLLGKMAMGVGGHINPVDISDLDSQYRVAMRREIDEEVIVGSKVDEMFLGLLNDDSNEVGSVHLGIVHLFRVETEDVRPREESMADAGFFTLEELQTRRDEFETWGHICLDFLTKMEHESTLKTA